MTYDSVEEKEAVGAEETVAAEVPAEAEEKKENKFLAGLKEWLRKTIIKLKRKTYIIPLILTLITSFVYLCMIGTFAQLIEHNSGIPYAGICMFVNTLASILILPLFLNAFPKRKKPQVVYIVLVFVVFALIIAMDAIFMSNIKSFFANYDASKLTDTLIAEKENSLQCALVHIILVCICVVVFALLPLYKKGLNMINTRKVIAENDFKEEIDTEAEV